MCSTNIIQLCVGAVVFKDDAVLLVKRKKPPNQSQWAIPGGKVRYNEPLKTAVSREILEEAGIVIHAQEPIYTFEVIDTNRTNDIPFHYVVIDFNAQYISGVPRASDDAEQARWISRKEYSSLNISNITKKMLREKFEFP
mgnify:CR=1 FL=1